MATSLTGPRLTSKAFAAAPDPRPPQPTRATWIVLFSPAYMRGAMVAATADTAASRPVSLRNSRRDVSFCVISLIVGLLLLTGVALLPRPTGTECPRWVRLGLPIAASRDW